MKTDKTDILFKQMYKEIDRIELEYRERIAQIVNDKNINDDDKKTRIWLLNHQKESSIQQQKMLHTQKVIEKGYNKTTQDISMLLDLEPGFCTRHIKEYIDFVKIPAGTSDLFKDYSVFNAIEQVELSKKKLLFNTNSLDNLIKHNLYEVDKFISLKINNISDLIEDKEDIYLCEILAEEFINKITKENEYRKSITDEQLNDIKNNKTTLLRQDSLKELVSQLLLRDKLKTIRRKINTDFIDKESPKKKFQEDLLDAYASKIEEMNNLKAVLQDLSLLKLGNMTHQTQITRKAKTLQHTRYHLVLTGRKQPINLYGIASADIKITEINELDKDPSSISVTVSVHSLYNNIEEDIYKYIEKNKKKEKKNKNS